MIRVPSSERVLAGYRFGPAFIDVETDDPDAARWLTEFLSPWFAAGAPGQGDFIVRLTCSPPAFANLERRHAVATCHPVACFALDRHVVSLPGWADDSGDTVIADSGRGCFYRVRPGSVEIVARPEVQRLRVGLMRVVRELAAVRTLSQGSILDVHAAAFAVGERAVLLAGSKGSGKTTLLVNVLASGQACLLANDRVFVDTSRQPGHAVGVPTMVAIREGTLQRFPGLRRTIHERPALLRDGETPRDVGTAEDDGGPRVFALTPAQLARRLGVTTRRCAPIAAIVFPEISSAVDTWTIEPIVPTDGAARLRQCLYGTTADRRAHTIFETVVGDPGHGRDEQTALVDEFVAELPLFRCRLGRDAYRDGAQAWLQALLLESAGGERRV